MQEARVRARLAASPSARAGAVVVGALVLFSVLGPLVMAHDPMESDFAHGVAPTGMPVGPGSEYLLGADRIFRDVLSRLAVAGRLSLTIALGATLLATSIGATVGILAGMLAGRPTRVPWPTLAGGVVGATAAGLGHAGAGLVALVVGIAGSLRGARGPRVDVDGALMRLIDVLLAFPFLLLVMALGASLDHTSALTILLTLGLTGWLGIARIVRAKTMQVRALDFIQASRALGQSELRVVLRHVLPNVAGPIVVLATVQVAQMIVADSVLSYLGVGIAPPTATWGRMLFEGQDYYAVAPWLVAAPGVAILLAVWGFNMLGEGLRDALDPRDA